MEIYIYITLTILASVFAFLKLFYKSSNIINYVIIGIIFSIFELLLRIPTINIGKNTLGLSVVYLQIIWIAMNFIISSILGLYLYKEKITFYKFIGMMIILWGVFISAKS